MRKVPVLPTAAAAIAVLMTACSSMEFHDPPGAAKTSAKLVMISVNGSQVTLFPDPVLVGAKNGVVKWIFDTNEPDYKFPVDGVTFPEPPVDPPSSAGCARVATAAEAAQRFNNCKPMKHDTEFHCNAVGATPPVGTCYYYALKLEPKAGGTPLVVDPWAKNL
jgi:hypothetical protein